MKRLHGIFLIPTRQAQRFVACRWLNTPRDTLSGARIPNLLVVDPDTISLRQTSDCLERSGHRVRLASGGEEALCLARAEAPDLVITELALPDISGLGLCRTLREDPSFMRIPILMLSASSAEMDRVVAFEVGVDDFVKKPFHPRELSLRVAAILRRASRASGPPQGEVLRHRRLMLDLRQHRACLDERPIPLTAREFGILTRLMQCAGRVLSRGQLLAEIWGTRSGKTPRVVDTHVKCIRRKLGSAGDYIETLRGVGYRFTDDDHPRGPVPVRPRIEPVSEPKQIG